MSGAVFLSVVLTGRNDDHGSHFSRRFIKALRFNDGHLLEHGIDHEFVFVEWAPSAGRRWLVDLVASEFPEVLSRCRWWLVDPRYEAACALNRDLSYPEFLAKNVGIRRAAGQFVLSSNCDACFGREVLNRCARQLLTPGILYRAIRHDLKLGLDLQDLDWSLLEDSRNHASRSGTLRPPFFQGGTGDFVMLDRETFHRLRGFNEIYRLARVGIDRNMLLHAYRNNVPIEDIGGAVYHINHIGSFRAARTMYEGIEKSAPYGDGRWGAGVITYDNPPTWGLGEAPAHAIRPGVSWIDFDWRAVPPLAPVHRLGVEVS